jgi:hypothetical protein
MAREDLDFLRRWSRRKREASAPRPRADAPAAPRPAALPALDSLSFDSDFGAFLRAKVDEQVKRAALKKLFADPRFNVMDGLDIYIDDYSKEEPIPAAMLSQLEHARATLFGPPAAEEEPEAEGTTTTRQDSPHEPTQADPLPT